MTQYLFVLIVLALTHVLGHCSLGDSFPSYRNCVLECTEKRCDKGNAFIFFNLRFSNQFNEFVK